MVCTPLYAGGCLKKQFDTPPPIFGFPKINVGVWCRIRFFRRPLLTPSTTSGKIMATANRNQLARHLSDTNSKTVTAAAVANIWRVAMVGAECWNQKDPVLVVIGHVHTICFAELVPPEYFFATAVRNGLWVKSQESTDKDYWKP